MPSVAVLNRSLSWVRSGQGLRYYLTPAGQELAELVLQMGTWGARWLDLTPGDYDPDFALWTWARLIDAGRLPQHRIVVRFHLTDRAKADYWMLLQRSESEVCFKNPGLDEDLLVTTDSVTLSEVHRGRLGFAEAQASGRFSLTGLPDAVKGFPTWGGVSPSANVKPARSAAG